MTNAITGVADGAKDSTKTSVMTAATASTVPGERTLLIVEDDKSFLQRLARAMETRGFVVSTAESVADGLLQVEKAAPAFAGLRRAPSSSPATATSRPRSMR